MQITIIGAGNMARGIATRALASGHTVRIIDRAPDNAARLAAGRGSGRPLGRAHRTRAAAISRTWPCHEGNPALVCAL
jgi:3-hydroxyisobutyrate dehydrogenase-like beta-hydroxyacid dehydrogenase